ncbi:hypothetical protein DSO57_1011939 [Entomophthora muscae]|uniref:Uncharacterized protein n=1 Tax=Entomophthora muscae TaxID=34485 RepID=A0ACC2U4T2_9FUNG|nr:hypothetical protein DSO57_1011939 [Entomophthora muscae]
MNSDFFVLQPSKEFSALGDLHLERAKAWNVANKACCRGNLESHSSEAKIQAYLQQYHHHLFFKWAIFSFLAVISIVCLVAFIIFIPDMVLGLSNIFYSSHIYHIRPQSILGTLLCR